VNTCPTGMIAAAARRNDINYRLYDERHVCKHLTAGWRAGTCYLRVIERLLKRKAAGLANRQLRSNRA